MKVNGNLVSSQDDPYRIVRQRMNSVRVSEPLIAALIERPGLGASASTMDEAVNRLSSAYRQATEELLAIIAPAHAGNGMFRAVVSRMMARVISLIWKAGQVEDPGQIARRAMTIVRPLIETVEPQPDTVFTDLPAATQEALSEASALTNLAPALMRLGAMPERVRNLVIGMHDMREAAERVRSVLRRLTLDGVGAIRGPERPGGWVLTESQLSAVHANVIGSVSQVMAASLSAHIDARVNLLRKMSPEQRREEYERKVATHPDRWGALERMERDVEQMCKDVLFQAARQMRPEPVAEPPEKSSEKWREGIS